MTRNLLRKQWWQFALVGVIGLMVAIVAILPLSQPDWGDREIPEMQTARTLAIALFQYANDNGVRYPEGKSSTEVFQKLIDGNYIADPKILFVRMPGKTPATTNKLRPENVAFDVTSGVDQNTPDGVPLVYLTGFRIEYRAGGSATSLVKPFPSTVSTSLFAGDQIVFAGLPVAYRSNNAFFRSPTPSNTPSRPGHSTTLSHQIQYTADGYGIVPNILPPDFDAHGQTYHQLTPEGVLN